MKRWKGFCESPVVRKKGVEVVSSSRYQVFTSNERSAVFYAESGWSVIPLRSGEKRPALSSWKDRMHEPASPEEVESWWLSDPTRNIGIVTGMVSGIIVVDADGDDGLQTIQGLDIPITPTVKTPKGRHLYFRHPGHRVPNAVRMLPGLDLRGDGGFVVAPRSLHPGGAHYEWVDGLSPMDVELAPIPPWLVTTQGHQEHAHSTLDWRKLSIEGAVEGQRNSCVASMTGHLLRLGVDPHVALDLVLAWNSARNRPPLSDEEVMATVDSIAKLELARRRGVEDVRPC